MTFTRFVVGVFVGALAIYGLSALLTFATTTFGGDIGYSQTAAAWFQAIGAVLAIFGAYHLSDRQSRTALAAVEKAHNLALQTRVRGHYSVVQAAMLHVYQFNNALAAIDPPIALLGVYDKVVTRRLVAALTSIPAYELGNPAAVVPLLSMRDQFAFLEVAFETYLAGPFCHPDLKQVLDTLQRPGDSKQFDEVLKVSRGVLASNVKVHLRKIEEDFDEMTKAIGQADL